jgi:hypothetical protein
VFSGPYTRGSPFLRLSQDSAQSRVTTHGLNTGHQSSSGLLLVFEDSGPAGVGANAGVGTGGVAHIQYRGFAAAPTAFGPVGLQH